MDGGWDPHPFRSSDPSTKLTPRRTFDRVSGPTQGNHEGLPLRGKGWIHASAHAKGALLQHLRPARGRE